MDGSGGIRTAHSQAGVTMALCMYCCCDVSRPLVAGEGELLPLVDRPPSYAQHEAATLMQPTGVRPNYVVETYLEASRALGRGRTAIGRGRQFLGMLTRYGFRARPSDDGFCLASDLMRTLRAHPQTSAVKTESACQCTMPSVCYGCLSYPAEDLEQTLRTVLADYHSHD